MKLWLQKIILKLIKVEYDEPKPEVKKLLGQDRTIAISQCILSNKFPDNPELKEAFIKHWFLTKNVSPDVVDNLPLQLISDIIEIDSLKSQLSDMKNLQNQDVQRMKNGTTNTSKVSPRHKRS